MPATTSSRTSRRRYAPRVPAGERREQVLDAALALIERDGYGAVTMEAVAREIGVTKPVVYDVFDNRGELPRALLEREEQRAFAVLATVVPALPPDTDPDEVLAGALGAFLTTVRDQPERWRLILLPVEGTPDVVRRHVEQGRRQILEQPRGARGLGGGSDEAARSGRTRSCSPAPSSASARRRRDWF